MFAALPFMNSISKKPSVHKTVHYRNDGPFLAIFSSRHLLDYVAHGSVILVLICTAGLSVWWANAGPQSYLSIDKLIVDFGDLMQQEERVTTFEIRNVSRSEVDIKRVVASCSCTGSTIGDMHLLPGESTLLEARFSTSTSRGQVSSTINVFYLPKDHQRIRSLVATISANVVPHFEVLPNDKVMFESANSPAEREIVISPNSGAATFEVLDAYCTHAAFTTKLRKLIADANQTKVIITFDPKLWKDKLARPQLIVETNSSMQPLITIPVYFRSS